MPRDRPRPAYNPVNRYPLRHLRPRSCPAPQDAEQNFTALRGGRALRTWKVRPATPRVHHVEKFFSRGWNLRLHGGRGTARDRFRGGPQVFTAPDWAPWSLISGGAVTILNFFSLPTKAMKQLP